MSKLQTYISERRKLFRERFTQISSWSDEITVLNTANPEAIESFNSETEQGIIEVIRKVVVSLEDIKSRKKLLLFLTEAEK